MLSFRRLRTLLRAINSSTYSSTNLFATVPATVKNSTTNRESSDDVSSAYLRKLKSQKPNTIRWAPPLVNNVTLIGHVAMPLVRRTSGLGSGVGAVLIVSSANSSFRVWLQMWDDLAEMCYEHLKQDDFIYVSGRLKCYDKDDQCGNVMTRYKVKVSELYYVSRPNRLNNSGKHNESLPERRRDLTDFDGHRNSIYLWQVFFSNPWEWWDNRKTKKSMRMPDFKHKDTGECLWIDHRDPPWVKRQLELLDSKMADQWRVNEADSRRHPTLWEYDE